MKDKIARVYVDGAYSAQRERGAAAFVVTTREYDVLHEGGEVYTNTTANRTEIWAAIHGLDWCIHNVPKLRPVIYTDSKYLNMIPHALDHWQRCGWENREGDILANLELILLYGLLLMDCPHHVESFWIKGHNGHVWNERAHDIATSLVIGDSPAMDDRGGEVALLSQDDVGEIVLPMHVNRVLQYLYRIANAPQRGRRGTRPGQATLL